MHGPTEPKASLPAHELAFRADISPPAVLEYWLEDGVTLGWPKRDLGKLWFGGGAALDEEISTRFGHAVRHSLSGGLRDWEQPALSRLALVILLDQFARNVFRGQAAAFAGDTRAAHLVSDAIGKGWDTQLPLAGRVFLYMPLMHAENLELQEQCASFSPPFTLAHQWTAKKVCKAISTSPSSTGTSLPASGAFRIAMQCLGG